MKFGNYLNLELYATNSLSTLFLHGESHKTSHRHSHMSPTLFMGRLRKLRRNIFRYCFTIFILELDEYYES